MSAGAAGGAAAVQLAQSLVQARQARKERKRKARKDLAEATTDKGKNVSKAIGSIVDNLRSTLVR